MNMLFGLLLIGFALLSLRLIFSTVTTLLQLLAKGATRYRTKPKTPVVPEMSGVAEWLIRDPVKRETALNLRKIGLFQTRIEIARLELELKLLKSRRYRTSQTTGRMKIEQEAGLPVPGEHPVMQLRSALLPARKNLN